MKILYDNVLPFQLIKLFVQVLQEAPVLVQDGIDLLRNLQVFRPRTGGKIDQ